MENNGNAHMSSQMFGLEFLFYSHKQKQTRHLQKKA
jgi:hypothetical protein